MATREGHRQIALQATGNGAVTGAQHGFCVVTMPASARRLNNSRANSRFWILFGKSVHELQTRNKNGFPTLKIGGGGPYTPPQAPPGDPAPWWIH